MRIEGRLVRSGRWWAVEVPALFVFTQGRTKAEAYAAAKDAIESVAAPDGLEVRIEPTSQNLFFVSSDDVAALVALLLERQRTMAGRTVREAAKRMGSKSPTAYSRYERGKSVPSVEKLSQLLEAASGGELVIGVAGGQ